MKLILPAAAALTAVALCIPVATAAPSRHATAQGSFCATAKAVAKYLHTTLQLTSSGVVASTPANLKLAYTTVVHDEGALAGGAPASLKPSLSGAFSFVNLVSADFAKAGWQIKNMTPYFPALVAKGNAEAKPIATVRTYLRSTCHLGV